MGLRVWGLQGLGVWGFGGFRVWGLGVVEGFGREGLGFHTANKALAGLSRYLHP